MLFLWWTAAHAQDRTDWRSLGQLRAGDRIAVSLKAHGRKDGTFQSWSAEQIALDSGSVRREDVQTVRRFRTGGWSRGRTALLGAAIGGGAGLAAGLGTGGNCAKSYGPCISRGALGGALGGIGAVIGAGIGALIPHHRIDVVYTAGP